MNREEAKYILHAYRPGGQDANDPQFREALELLKYDAELAQWFARELAFDSRIAARFQAVPVPPHLKSRLLAAGKVVSVPSRRWRTPAWFAAAAAVVLLLSAGAFWLVSRGNRPFAEFREAMVQASLDMDPHVSVIDLDLGRARRWLADHGAHGDFSLPAGLRDHSNANCRVLDWRGNKISLLCFHLENGGHADLFVIPEDSVVDLLPSPAPHFARLGDVTTATWRQDGYLYLLAGKDSDLERLL